MPEVDIKCLLQLLSMNLELTYLDRLTVQQVPGILLSPPQCWTKNAFITCTRLFTECGAYELSCKYFINGTIPLASRSCLMGTMSWGEWQVRSGRRRGMWVRRAEGAGRSRQNRKKFLVFSVCWLPAPPLQLPADCGAVHWKEVLSSPKTTDLAQGTQNVHSPQRQEDQRKPSLRQHAAHCSQSSSWEKGTGLGKRKGREGGIGHPNVQ